MDFTDIDSGVIKIVQTSKAARPDLGPILLGILYAYYLGLFVYKYYKTQGELEAMKKLMETNAPDQSRDTDKMNAVNNTYRFFVAGQRVATGKILKDKTILQVYPYQHGTGHRGILYKPPFQTLTEWQRAFEATSGRKIDYIEEEGRDRSWKHERIPDEPLKPITRPPFLEPVSPRTPHKVVDAEDEWEAVRSNAPDAPRAAEGERKKHLDAAIDGLTKALEALKMM